MRNNEVGRVIAILVLVAVSSASNAAIISEFTDGTRSDVGFYGAIIATENDGVADVLESFTFLGPDGSTAVGSGLAYLFDSAYTGTPSDLSGSSFLAVSSAYAGTEYSFASTMPILDPDTLYYVYSDSAIDAGYQFDFETTSANGHQFGFFSAAPFSPPGTFLGGVNYRAESSSVPIPPTVLLLGFGMAGLGWVSRRSKI